ncbi:MAG: RpiB/LacA/LacB family sugar-phosphate isomerase [Patescibacteria group bacterium]
MKVFFAGDHAGFELKGKLIAFVRSLGHEVEDMGPHAYDAGDDYVDFVIPLARKVASQAQTYADDTQNNAEKSPRRSASSLRQSASRGIVVAGSGQGEIIAMNRIRGARAALFCPGPQSATLIKASRAHNDSNIFAIGARFCTLEEAKEAVRLWLDTPFSGAARHIRRLQKIEEFNPSQG